MMNKKSHTLPIIIMFALFFMIAFVTGLQNPLGLIVKEQFNLGNWGSQLPTFANFLAYAFMGIPAGLLLQKIGYKSTAKAAVATGLAGIVVMFLAGLIKSDSIMAFCVYLFGAFVGGLSMCMLNTVVNPMLNKLGGGSNRGNQLIQTGGVCNSVAATLAPVLGGYLIAGALGERTISTAFPIFYLVMAIFFIALVILHYSDIPEPNIELRNTKMERSPLAFRHFTLGAIAIFVYVGIEVGIPNIANLFMVSSAADGGLAMDATMAGTITGTYWFLMLIGRVFGSVLAKKFSSKSMLVCVSTLGLVLILLAVNLPTDIIVNMPVFKSDISFGLAAVPISIMFFVLCGLCTSVMWGGIFNLAVEGLGKYTEAASGIFMVMVCGGGVLPLLQGFIADKTSYLSSFIVIILGFGYMLYYAFIGSKNVNKDIKTL